MPACCWLYDENINYEEEKLGMGPSIYAHDTTVYKAKIVQIPKCTLFMPTLAYTTLWVVFFYPFDTSIRAWRVVLLVSLVVFTYSTEIASSMTGGRLL